MSKLSEILLQPHEILCEFNGDNHSHPLLLSLCYRQIQKNKKGTFQPTQFDIEDLLRMIKLDKILFTLTDVFISTAQKGRLKYQIPP